MRRVNGLDEARRALCVGRGLGLDDVPAAVRDKIQAVFGEPLSPVEVAQRILGMVRSGGDSAVAELTRKLDGVALDSVEVPRSAIQAAYDAVPAALTEALRLAAERVRAFHSASLTGGWFNSDEGYGEIVNPVGSVGVYVPGGTAAYPSTVLMTAIPAKVAGVDRVIISTPAGKSQLPSPAVLVAADLAGVDQVFTIGGAQAVAAMAYGTETVPAVDMVCGPGNVFVTLAKKQLYGEVGIDGLYGPTETMIIADEGANATLCAADLVAQAEHDEMARPVLVTTSTRLADEVAVEAMARAQGLDRSRIATASLQAQGCIAVLDEIEDALALAAEFAPEHLSLMVDNAWALAVRVQNAGAVFIGNFSHEVLGDYVAGPSHAMPTGGTARFSSGVGVHTFLKRTPLLALSEETSARLAIHAAEIGRAEGLTGHAEAAEIRLELSKEP